MKSFLTLLVIAAINIQFFAQTPGEIGPITSIDSFISFQGYDEAQAFFGQGEYQIYYDNIDGVLDKPLLIVDGFDPEDNNDISDLYGFLTYNTPPQNYLDELRDQGIDIIILNFPTYTRASDGETINGGGDYIERNGQILVNLIQLINSTKVGSEELIIVGPSMGGLVTRYALTYMEQNALDHESGLWISFDSPHLGANIPISFQYAINYMAEITTDADMINMRDAELNSAAAKQMLLDHYTSHLQTGSATAQDLAIQLPTPHDFRTTFVNTLNTLGFPTETRNIAISNGSTNSTMIESPGATVMDTNLDLGSNFGMDMRLHYTPVANTVDFEVDHIQPTFSGTPVGDAYETFAESPATTSGIDSAPGGSVLFESFFGDNPTDIELQIINALLLDAFSFIPSLSSLAIEDADWYNPIDGSESTPFENYINGDDNEEHLTFHQEYVDFLNTEISNFYLDIKDVAFSNQIHLLGNPIKETIKFIVNTEYVNLNVQVFNTNGQLLSQHTVSNHGQVISLASPKNAGVYYLKIRNNNQTSIHKFIVN